MLILSYIFLFIHYVYVLIILFLLTDYRGGVFLYRRTSEFEIVLLLMFIVAWSLSIVCFFSRWNTVSHMQPVGNRYSGYSPQNLHTVEVVNNAEDSVIYCK